jgi:hypothetical protein
VHGGAWVYRVGALAVAGCNVLFSLSSHVTRATCRMVDAVDGLSTWMDLVVRAGAGERKRLGCSEMQEMCLLTL